MTGSRRASLLVVLAHPDDEIFHGGTYAYLSERGARVVLASATCGDAGKVHPSLGPVTDLGTLREAELRLSCARLGIDAPLLLGFHDSARGERLRRDDPRALANVDMLEIEAAIREVIREVKPHVVVTHDPHGGYYHPDHLAVHRATTAAFFASGALGAEAPERLFYGTMARDAFRVFAEASRGRGFTDGLDPDVFGTAPEMTAVTFDATAYLHRKLTAIAAHRSQFGLTLEMLDDLPPGQAAMLRAFHPVLEREVFALGGARGPLPGWPLGDFFDGLESAALGAAVEEPRAASDGRGRAARRLPAVSHRAKNSRDPHVA
jgi:N-acetyl-1-D-myo-inositol-2-amino-2-deoxy-alpha-D-glucopyranoside deacetylase